MLFGVAAASTKPFIFVLQIAAFSMQLKEAMAYDTSITPNLVCIVAVLTKGGKRSQL
jgi:hypothetical protein